MVSQNPFTVGQPVPPERFVGRISQIATAFDQIHSRSNLAIWGGAGIGKSSFLELLTYPEVWQLQEQDPSNAVIVYLNCLSIIPFTPSRFWRKLLKLLQEKLDGNAAWQSVIDRILENTEVTREDIGSVLKKIGEQDKFLVLLLDDYDATLRTNAQYTEADREIFLSECRDLAYHSEEKRFFSMIVASRRRLNEIGPKLTEESSPWYNHYLFLPLKPFTKDEVVILLSGTLMTHELREGISEIADGHPALLQNAAHLLYGKLRDRQTPNAETFAREFLERTEQFFQDTWELCNEVEQTLLMLVALSRLKGRLQNQGYDLGDIGIIFSQRERELTDLEQRGVIKRSVDSDGTIYSFSSSIMEWWVIKEIENSNEEGIQERQKMFLDLMSRKQAERVKTVIRYLWEHRDDVKSMVEWIGKLAGAFPKGFFQG
ncbi:MAG: ATP-binding protein [Hormoscilla sp. GUM202]|nr:ATP-binding protein [Hormoscilla sp. GUM202]